MLVSTEFAAVLQQFLDHVPSLGTSIEEFEKQAKEKNTIDLGSTIITFEMKRSRYGTKACALRYVLPIGKSPLDVRINSEVGYTRVRCRVKEALPGYTFPRAHVTHGRQEKFIETVLWVDIAKELTALRDYCIG